MIFERDFIITNNLTTMISILFWQNKITLTNVFLEGKIIKIWFARQSIHDISWGHAKVHG